MALPLSAIRTGFRERRPRARQRDIAQALHVSEGELIAAHAGAFDGAESPLQARRLRDEGPRIVGALEAAGELMALTRNDSCVHEKTGVYRNASVGGTAGLVLGGEIDLRVFYDRWAHGFAVEERLADGALQRSLQFFDAAGQAIHKVFARPASDLAAWADIVDRFAETTQVPGIEAAEPAAPAPERADESVDVDAFRDAWTSMHDTHEFSGILKRFGLARTQALRLAPPDYAQRVPAASAHEVLGRAAQDGTSIMVFVGNPGMIQIHSGAVRRVEVMGPWLNVLDPRFSLHLREDHIDQAWVVKKPTRDGLVHSLELFDAQGATIAMLFGERKPGRAERCGWRTLLATLSPEVEPCAG
jgi:putative hemin transport protein